MLLGGTVLGAARAELPVPAAAWATSGRASLETQGNALIVRQYTDRAILNWDSFDIGRDNAVHFRQPDAASIALNRIAPGDHPSRILGRLDANGQLYLVNPNGFVFGPNARVDTNSLVASSLDISDQAFGAGLTRIVNQSQGDEPEAALTGSGEVYRKDAAGQTITGPDGRPEKIAVRVEQGARIGTHGTGGRIVLAAPRVENRGSLSAPDGQVVLAAATDKVYLQEADPESNLRGILVEVKTGGDVRNLGRIAADRGNVTAVGYAVYQEGRVSASTSVSLNGSVRLLAREGGKLERASDGALHLVPGSTRRQVEARDGLGTEARVDLAGGSRTEVHLDRSGGTAVDEQTQKPSEVEIAAGRIDVRSGAAIVAPGGKIGLTASENPAHPLQATGAENRGRIVLHPGSRVDASGSRRTELPMERNVVEVELRDYELRDAPVQKPGPLHARTVKVDLRKGTPLADISGAVARIQRSVDERNAAGGGVELRSEGEVLFGEGAVVDVSGGSVRYRDGWIDTSKLISGDRIFDISEADPDRSYSGFLGAVSRFHPRWNQTETWQLPGPIAGGRFEAGYTEGRTAGSLDIQARNLALDGRVRARTLADRYQRESAQQPLGGKLAIDLAWSGQRQQDIRFRNAGKPLGLDPDVPFPGAADGQALPELVLGRELTAGGVSRVDIGTAGRIAVDRGTQLTLPAGGSLQLTGCALDVAGAVTAPAGTIGLATRLPGGEAANLGGDLHLAAGARLDAGGRWVNDQPGSNRPLDPVALPVAGGQVSVQAVGKLILDAGSRIAADGGAWLQKSGEVAAGAGGAIRLGVAGTAPTRLDLGAELSAYGLDRGGSLSITANALRIAGTPDATDPETTLNLAPAFFQQGGFGDFHLTANAGSLTVGAGETLSLAAVNRDLDAGYRDRPTGAPLAEFSHPVVRPEILRTPVNLTLALSHDARIARYDPRDSLRVQQGATITTDPGGRLALRSDARLVLDGTLAAPTGSIDLRIEPVASALDRGYDPDQAIRLGSAARLLAPGATLLQPGNSGLRQGEVRPGGTVSLTAHRGYVLTESGSLIDVSGTADGLDLAGPGGRIERVRVPSDGGSIRLTAAEGIVAEGGLLARAGPGPGAAGGRLDLVLDAQARGLIPDNLPVDALPIPTGPRVIHLAQTGTPRLAEADTGIPAHWNGQAWLGADQVAAGGFASLGLQTAVIVPDSAAAKPLLPERGEIRMDGELSLNLAGHLALDAPVLAWARQRDEDAGTVALSAHTAAIGSTLNRTAHGDTVGGSGSLDLRADWLDLLGSMDLKGYGRAALHSTSDIRLRGINPQAEGDLLGQFSLAGDLDLEARQVYPSTFSRYALRVDESLRPTGTIRLLPGDPTARAPLSAGAALTIAAPNIESRGVLRAPLGEIDLVAGRSLDLGAGSLTSVSATGLVIPYGRTQGGLDWLFPVGAYNRVLAAPPAKAIVLKAPEVQLRDGATVDLAGGGDLLGFEFIRGPGGSVDVLDPLDSGYSDGSRTYRTTYAVLPGLGSRYAPYDPIDTAASGLKPGDSIELGPGSGLLAGRYALLPAHYALLPGAYLVTPQAGTADLPEGSSYRRLDGASVVSGLRVTAGTDFHAARRSGYAVEPGAVARTRSEFELHRANAFYAAKSADDAVALPELPRDAGHLTIGAERALELAGAVTAEAAPGGRGGRLDLAADRLRIVPDAASIAPEEGTVALAAEQLSRLDVASLFVGGHRSGTGSDQTLSLDARSVLVAPGSALTARELLLGARESVDVAGDASLRAAGRTADGGQTYTVDAGGQTFTGAALLRISTGPAARFEKARPDGGYTTGALTVGSGAMLETAGSLYLAGTAEHRLAGDIRMDGGDLTLEAGRIGLGPAPANLGGLVLSDRLLDGLRMDRLELVSLSTMDFYGSLAFKTGALKLSGAGLQGYGAPSDSVHIEAGTLELANPEGAVPAASAASGAGMFSATANRLTLGPGTQSWTGFAGIELAGRDAILAEGTADLTVAANLRLSAGKLATTPGANLNLDAGAAALALDRLEGGRPGEVKAGLGGRIALRAGSLAVNAPVDLPAGSFRGQSASALRVGSQGQIDAGGRAVSIGGRTLYAPGGSIDLASTGGDLSLESGSRLNVAAAAGGGDAGRIALSAGRGRIALDGELAGQGGAGGTGGVFSLDAAGWDLAGLGGLAGKLRSGGFDEAVSVRLRQGDLGLNPGETLKAHSLSLTADAGRIDLAGILDAGGPAGGTVNLNAGSTLRLAGGSRILAGAAAAGETGGDVNLTATGGDGVLIEPGAGIDVSAAHGEGGRVTVRVPRSGGEDAAVDIAAGAVTGAREATVEAVRTYPDQPLSNAAIAGWRAETVAYMSAAESNAGLRSRLGGFDLAPGVEVQSSGDLSLALSEVLGGRSWSRVGATNVWSARLDDLAGPLDALTQVRPDGMPRSLTAAASSALGTDGSYYFDADPASPNFRRLYVRVFPGMGAGADRYNPSLIRDSLVESNGWDLLFPDASGQAWRFGAVSTPGTLTLRAAGDLRIDRDLSDGFLTRNAPFLAGFFEVGGSVPNWRDTTLLQPGFSWSYRLVAGADLGSADVLATATDRPHSLSLGGGAVVRTGTGDIAAAASGDIRLTDAGSAIYTAGRATDSNRYGSLDPATVSRAFYAEYPVDGGSIRLSARGDVVGAPSPQFMSDWLVRTGSWDASDGIDGKDRPTAWGIAFDGLVLTGSANDRIRNLKFGFRQNLGALGGGDVRVEAGGSVRDLSAMLPTTAKPVGRVEDGRIVENLRDLRGGGDLTVTAGGDIAGGVYYVDRGSASLKARGAVTGGSQYTAGPVLASGDARFAVEAGAGIALGAVLNPFAITAPVYTDKKAYFSSYSAASSVSLSSLAGNVVLNNDTGVIRDHYKLFDAQNPTGRSVLSGLEETRMLSLYPGSLRVHALSDGIRVAGSFDLFPAAHGALELLADDGIAFGRSAAVTVNQSDADPALLLSPERPALSLNDAYKRLDIYNHANGDFLHATRPVHGDDGEPAVIASNRGDIGSGFGSLLVTAEPALVSAGRDLTGLGLEFQNLRSGDVSEVRAGRDLRFPIVRDPLTGQLDSSIDDLGITASGPGQLQVLAGRNVDLGTSAGLTTTGNLTNGALPAGGASLSVWAGTSRAADFKAFNATYLGEAGPYGEALAAYLRRLTGNPGLSAGEALAAFEALPETRQREFVQAVLFRELKLSGQAAAASRDETARDYRRGERAIAALFPEAGEAGDIRLFFSRIQTLDGGDINLLAPGGAMDVGLATAFSGRKTAADLGVVVQRTGNLNALARGDVAVNQSRLFTLAGGDITVWSERGDIDAGRGAKTSLAAPAPTTSFDAKGNLVVSFPPLVSGSGIRAQSGYTDAAAVGAEAELGPLAGLSGNHRGGFGDVTLVAPHGVINAGEAGIGGGNVTVAATAILGVANIQASGTLTGTPPPAVNFATQLSGAGTLTAGVSTAAQASIRETLTPRAAEARAFATPPPALRMLAVDLVGFGHCSVADVRRGGGGC